MWLFQLPVTSQCGVQKGTPAPPTCFPFKLLLEALAADQDDLECLGAENCDALWLKWVDKHLKEKTKAPGTLILYLCSLEMFLTYLTGRKYDPKKMPCLSPDLKDTFRSLIPALLWWRACIDSYTQDAQLRNYIAECDSLITTQEINNLNSSKPYQMKFGSFNWSLL